ncbi:MAG: hypothetical protein ACKOAH_33735, partial [Pirellula sp.]
MVRCAAKPAPPYAWLYNPSWIAPGNARKKLHSANGSQMYVGDDYIVSFVDSPNVKLVAEAIEPLLLGFTPNCQHFTNDTEFSFCGDFDRLVLAVLG